MFLKNFISERTRESEKTYRALCGAPRPLADIPLLWQLWNGAVAMTSQSTVYKLRRARRTTKSLGEFEGDFTTIDQSLLSL